MSIRKLAMLAFVLALPAATPASAAPYTKLSCMAESRYGEQGKWVCTQDWGCGCSFKTSWLTKPDRVIVFPNGKAHAYKGGKVGVALAKGVTADADAVKQTAGVR